jgi:uncharacterized protein (DUF697 family)/tellurite resistance protein
MNEQDTRSILTIALMAAFADGMKDEREREAVKNVADAFGGEGGVDLPRLYRQVLIDKPDLATVAAELGTREARQLAYEMAVGVCDADGVQGPAEKAFLSQLSVALQLPAVQARSIDEKADALAEAAQEPLTAGPTVAAAATGAAGASAPVSGTVLGKAQVAPAELDKMILNASITNAALELLPESLASMAIIPLQLRLVYRIGQSYGYQLDRSHAKDFLATLGVGLTGQYVEQIGRKLLGGLLGRVGGGLGGAVGRQAASSGMSFATTYALGRIAQRYYAAGRSMDTAMLKSTFAQLLEEAKGLAPRYRAEIEQRSKTIDTRELVSLVKQG